jgi:hypothetical protein
MKRGVSLSVTLLLTALALPLAWMWRMRSALPYNDQGRYYDSADSVVYTDSALEVLGLLAIVFAAAAVAAMLWAVRTWRR